MVRSTQEIVDKVIDGLGDKIPPALQKEARENFAGYLDKGMMPKDFLGLPDEFLEFGYKHAYNLFQAGKYREAIKIFDLLQSLNPLDFRFGLGAAASYHYLGEFEEAVIYYLKAQAAEPLNPVLSFHLYDCFMKLDQPVAALYELERTISLAERDPRYAEMKERALLERVGLIDHIKTEFAKL